MTALEEQVLALPQDSKQRLYDLLRSEFEGEISSEPMPVWLFDELEKRRQSYESGASQALPLAEAFASIRAELGQKR